MKIKQISDSELLITKNAWRKRLAGFFLACSLPLLPLVYKVTKDYLPEGSESYSVVTVALIGLFGLGMIIFSHNTKIRMNKAVSVEIGRRSLFGRTKKEIVNVEDIQAVQVVTGRSTDLAFIMKNGSTAVHFYSHDNMSFLGLGGKNDMANETQQIADFLGVPVHSKGSVMQTEFVRQAVGAATEVLRPDTVKMAAANEDHWEQQRLGKESAHQKLEDRETRKELFTAVLPKVGSEAGLHGPQPILNEQTVDMVNRLIERPDNDRR